MKNDFDVSFPFPVCSGKLPGESSNIGNHLQYIIDKQFQMSSKCSLMDDTS